MEPTQRELLALRARTVGQALVAAALVVFLAGAITLGVLVSEQLDQLNQFDGASSFRVVGAMVLSQGSLLLLVTSVLLVSGLAFGFAADLILTEDDRDADTEDGAKSTPWQ